MSIRNKQGGTKGVSPRGETLAIIEEGEKYGINVNEMLNSVLDKNRPLLKKLVDARKSQLRDLLSAP